MDIGSSITMNKMEASTFMMEATLLPMLLRWVRRQPSPAGQQGTHRSLNVMRPKIIYHRASKHTITNGHGLEYQVIKLIYTMAITGKMSTGMVFLTS